MIQIIKHKGFLERWLSWMGLIFGSGTSVVFLNGVPGKVFHCNRGVRQGDPLSPLLFVLDADFLQTLLNSAKDRGLLQLPVNLPHIHDFPILQYVDDTLIFMLGDGRQMFFLKALLHSFAESTSFRVNYSKSMMILVNVSKERFEILAQTFGCSKGNLPFIYPGLPVSLHKPTIADFWPLVNKCERRLISTSNFLNEARRLQIVNDVFSALPTFAMCTFLLPKTIIKQIDRFRKHCL